MTIRPQLLRTVVCFALVGFVPQRAILGQTPFPPAAQPDPGGLAGYWEAKDPFNSGTQIGILVKIVANRQLPPQGSTAINTRPPQRLISLDVGVYQRSDTGVKIGWFSAVPQGGALWDGHRLQVRFKGTRPTDFVQGRLDIDLAFNQTQQSWLGTYGRKNETRAIALTRPLALRDDPSSPFVGAWLEHGIGWSRCFYIAQAADGTFLSWRNSGVGPVIIPRHMDRMFQETDGDPVGVWVDRDTITLQEGIYWSILAGNLPRKFIGKLSPGRSQIVGRWVSPPAGGEPTPPNHVNSGTLSRVTGSCWSHPSMR
jgi:hypothetical protein